MNIKTKIQKECQICKKEFFVIPSNKKRKLCSIKCLAGFNSKRLQGRKLFSEVIKKMSLNRKGKTTWNKELKGYRSGKGTRPNIMPIGEKHWSYIKDRTKLKIYGNDNKDRRSSAYDNWIKEIWTRDNYKCRLNNINCNGEIEVHYIFSYRDYPELRFIINNGITLCQAHHPRKRAEEKRMIPIFQELLSVSKE